MKKTVKIISLIMSLLMLMCALPTTAFALDKDPYPYLLTQHPYVNDLHTSWTYTHDEPAEYLWLLFHSETSTEYGHDYITITDAAGSYKMVFSGDWLANEVIVVPGNSFILSFDSDWENTDFGFAVTKIGVSNKAAYDRQTASVSITKLVIDNESFVYDLDDVHNGLNDKIIGELWAAMTEMEIKVTLGSGETKKYVWGTEEFDEAGFFFKYDFTDTGIIVTVEYKGAQDSEYVYPAEVKKINAYQKILYWVQAHPFWGRVVLYILAVPIAFLTSPLWIWFTI